VLVLLVGFAGGPLSSVVLRDWEPLRSLHGVLGLCAATLFATTGVLGLRLARGDRSRRDLHGLLGTLAMLVGALAAAAGFVLLP